MKHLEINVFYFITNVCVLLNEYCILNGVFVDSFSDFFITNINRLSHKTIQNICLITFADGLIELLKKRKTDLNYNNAIIYPNSEEINNKLIDHFIEYSVTGR